VYLFYIILVVFDKTFPFGYILSCICGSREKCSTKNT